MMHASHLYWIGLVLSEKTCIYMREVLCIADPLCWSVHIGCAIMGCTLLSLSLTGCDQVKGNFACQSQQPKLTNVPKGTPATFTGVACGVSSIVEDSSQNPDSSKDRRCDWVLKTGKQQGHQIRRESFERVLMDTLVAIEDVLLVIFLDL